MQIIETGGGCTAYYHTEADAPGLVAVITCNDDPSIPEEADFERGGGVYIGIYTQDDGSLPIDSETFMSREAMNRFYVEEVGYSPDQEADRCGFPRESLEGLLETVAGILLIKVADLGGRV
jgi:hypothetical protein